jgi:hypothetical protein
MTFTPNIPQSGQSLGQTRDPIRDNFTNYNTVVSVDHMAPNSADQGRHKQVTLNTFGAFPYAAAGTRSFVGSYNASAAGTQLVYQPSVATKFVPCAPRSMGRITMDGGGNYSIAADDGPYGAGTRFNFGSVSTTTAYGIARINFASALASSSYFVVLTTEGGVSSSRNLGVYTKNAAWFEIFPKISAGSTLTFMVF